MMKRLRAFFESIVFAGMSPGASPGQAQGMKWLGPLRGPVERFLSGGTPKDPLYLTNRSLSQRIRGWVIVAIPCLLIIGFVALTLSKNFFNPPDAPIAKEMTPAEISRKILPNLGTDLKIDARHDVDIVEAHIEHRAGLTLTGSIRNNSAHEIAVVEFVFNLTDTSGSQLGAVDGRVENLGPKVTKSFQIPLAQQNAAFAMVRDLTTR